MEGRLKKLATLWSADSKAIQEASWSVQWAVQFPTMDDDKAGWAARIRQSHELDAEGERRAIALAARRLGIPRDQAAYLSSLGLEGLLELTVADPGEMDFSGV